MKDKFKKEKIVGFAGHRHEWQNVGIEAKLKETIIELIEKGYNVFYCGDKGYFDELSAKIVLQLKEQYPQIKLYSILTAYHEDKEKWQLPRGYDGSLYPELGKCHFKAKITKKNEWIVDNIDILVCYVHQTLNSGAFNTVKSARKIGKPIIYLEPQQTSSQGDLNKK